MRAVPRALWKCSIGLGVGAGSFCGTVQAATLAAWVELIGPGPEASVRVITTDADCPEVKYDGSALPMQVRAEPGPLFVRDSSVPTADFASIRVCEADVPGGKTDAQVDGRSLPLPKNDLKRIVIFGDTGCRIKKRKTQDCNDPEAWPYWKIIARAAAARPDLVIHVGDYLYREKSCEGFTSDCPSSATGYGWDVWNADFFAPSAPLFAVAPWLMVRGNHETCYRAGEGWFRFLDPSKLKSGKCPAMSPSFVVAPGGSAFVVVDSAAVADEEGEVDDDTPGHTVDLIPTLRDAYSKISSAIPPKAWLVTHVPVKGVRIAKGSGDSETDNTVLQDALGGLFTPSVTMIVSGHIHIFEAFSFTDGSPPQLIVGTGGDKLAKKPDKPDDVAGIPIKEATILKNFGYMVWDRVSDNRDEWNGILFDEDGLALARCELVARNLKCMRAR